MWKTVIQISKREIGRIADRPLYFIGLLIAPLIISILIPRIYTARIMQKMPTIVVDYDQSHFSRTFTRLLNQHRYIHVKEVISDMERARRELQKNNVMLVVVIPDNFEKNLKSGHQPTLGVYSFGANLLVGNIAYKAIVEMYTNLGGQIAASFLMSSKGESAHTRSTFPPVDIDFHNLYNPSFSYLNFLPPGALIALFQMIVVLIASTWIANEYQDKTLIELLRWSNGKLLPVLIGKMLPTIGIMMIYGIFLFAFIFPVAGIPLKSGFIIAFLYWGWFIMISAFLGLLFSMIFYEEILATEAAVFITAPAFAFSGYTYPLWELPKLHQWFAYCMPSTHFLPIFTQIYIQGSPLSLILERSIPFFIYTVIIILALLLVGKVRKTKFKLLMVREG